jgi:hypothetical protein
MLTARPRRCADANARRMDERRAVALPPSGGDRGNLVDAGNVTARDQDGACDRTITDQAEEGMHCAARPHPGREERTKGRRIKPLPRFT